MKLDDKYLDLLRRAHLGAGWESPIIDERMLERLRKFVERNMGVLLVSSNPRVRDSVLMIIRRYNLDE